MQLFTIHYSLFTIYYSQRLSSGSLGNWGYTRLFWLSTKTSKKDNLILNVDGTIGILMVDMWRALGYTEKEINEFIESGTLNAFFILGRSIGFIGHILDEKRLGMPMYRHPWDDILYQVDKAEEI